MAEFQSVFDLIPSDKFHSAIVTGYSFDFCFFERVLLGQLHRAGVTNCLALIDQAMLDESLGRLTGAARTRSRGYSLVGIPSKGAFHPKLIFLAGEEDGLLFVGSGNPTASGFGGNLELWGAVSASEPSDSKMGALKRAWSFLSEYKPLVGGRSVLRFNWIEKHAPWLTSGPSHADTAWLEMDEGNRCRFLGTGRESILKQVKGAIGAETISKIEVFAPFFDTELNAIKSLSESFNCQDVDIYLQPRTVQFSSSALSKFQKRPNVYDLNHALGIEDQSSYLHAKAIRLESKNKNFLLIGSANASVAALGNMDFIGTNDEACLLLERSAGDFFEELGLRKGELVQVTVEHAPDADEGSQPVGSSRSIHLKGIDFSDGIIECNASPIEGRLLPKAATLRVFDGWGSSMIEIPVDCAVIAAGNLVRLKCRLDRDGKALFAQLFDCGTGLAASNAQLIHDINDIFRADPDPANRKLEAALSKLEFGEADIFDVLRIIDLNVLIDEPTETQEPTGKGQVGVPSDGGDDASVGGEKLDYESFINDQKESSPLDQITFRKSLQIERIFEVLAMLLNRTRKKNEDIQLEEEESESTTASFDRPEPENLAIEIREESAAQIRNLKKRIARFLRDYNKKVDLLIEDPKPLSVADLTRFCVISHMAIGFAGITVKEKKAAAEDYKKPMPLLEVFADPFDNACVTGFMFNCVGAFLRASLAGFVDEGNELELERIRALKETALLHVLFILALIPEEKSVSDQWTVERWNSWRWGIVQNAVFVLGLSMPDGSKLMAEFEKRRKICPIESSAEEMVARIARIFRHCVELDNSVEPNPPKAGSRAYFPKFGFVTIKQVEPMPTQGNLKIKFSGPGFPFDEDQFDFVAGSAFVWPKAKIRVFQCA